VQTASGPYLVLTVNWQSGFQLIRYYTTQDGVTWSGPFTSGTLSGYTNYPGTTITHGGLLFLNMPGRRDGATRRNQQAFDPVGGSISDFAGVSGNGARSGSFFKFDGRFFLIAGITGVGGGAATPAYFNEFKFGTWARLTPGVGYTGPTMYLGSNAGAVHYGGKCAAVPIDDDTVLVFSGGSPGGAQLFKAYEITLTGGSGGDLTVVDVSATYDPVFGGTAGEYQFTYLGKGPDGIPYMAFAINGGALGGYGLIKVIKNSPLADGGAMGANTNFSLAVAALSGGDRRDGPALLPLVKPSPTGSSSGPTGMIQNFSMSGDPLVCLHGAVAAGPFIDGEAVTWTGGSGVVLAIGAAELHLHTIVGVVPDGLLMTGNGGANATCSTSSGNGQAHTARLFFFRDANATGLGAPDPVLQVGSGYGTLVAGSGVNCTVSKGTGPGGTDEVMTDADGSGQIKSFEWEFLLDGVFASGVNNVKLQASRV
jgi:hypothetical protein